MDTEFTRSNLHRLQCVKKVLCILADCLHWVSGFTASTSTSSTSPTTDVFSLAVLKVSLVFTISTGFTETLTLLLCVLQVLRRVHLRDWLLPKELKHLVNAVDNGVEDWLHEAHKPVHESSNSVNYSSDYIGNDFDDWQGDSH